VAEQRHEDGSPIRDKKGKDISWTTYVTALASGKQHGQKIRQHYRQRWGIENQGFRYLSQTWNIDRPAGHSYGAVLARLVFVFMVFNAGQLFQQACRQRPDYAAQLRRMRSYGPGVRLAGATNIAITEPACGRQVWILWGLYHSGTAAARTGAHSANLAARPEVGLFFRGRTQECR